MVDESFYDEEYFERGKAGYTGYTNRGTLNYWIISLYSLWYALFLKIIFRPRKVLEVGCASGKVVGFLKKLGVEAYGIDVSKYIISRVPENLKNCCQTADVLRIPFSDNNFDLVCSFATFEHLPTEDINRALGECLRVSNRYVYLEIYLEEDDEGFKLQRLHDPSHVSVYPQIWWKDLFKKLNIRESGKNFPRFRKGVFLLEKV